MQKRKSFSPESFYKSVINFLKIRGDDSRAAMLPNLKIFEGIGYCISISSFLDEVKKIREQLTSYSEYPILYWPRKKKDEPPLREIVIPEKDYSVFNEENARIALNSKRFCSSLENEVIKAFEEANKLWLKNETKFDKENIPPLEESPVKRIRKIAQGKYVFISLVREDRIQYEEIINTLVRELKEIQEGKIIREYRYAKSDNGLFMNITSALKRIEKLSSELVKTNVRYEIAP